MSVKEVQKHEKSKKASEVHSQKHDDKPAKSISSLSNHLQQFQNQFKSLKEKLENSQNHMEFYRQRIEKFTGSNNRYSIQMAKQAEEEFQIWSNLKAVGDKLKQIYSSPKKDQKKRNYALKKVQDPPVIMNDY